MLVIKMQISCEYQCGNYVDVIIFKFFILLGYQPWAL